MKTKNIIIYIVICLIVIAGLAVWNAKGFKSELQFSSRKEIQLSNNTGLSISEVEEICKDVLGDTKFFVQPVENFGNSALIVAKDITDEQKTKIVEKFNEKYKTELKSDNIKIESIPFTRIKDTIKPFIVPGILTLIVVLVYSLVRFKNLDWKQVILKILLTPAVLELLLFSIISIARIPFGRIAIACGVGIYGISIFVITAILENQREKLLLENENN